MVLNSEHGIKFQFMEQIKKAFCVIPATVLNFVKWHTK